MSHSDDLPEVRGYERWQVYLSALVGLVVAAVLVWAASGFAVFHEALFRVGPTVEGGGVGADWFAGNTIPWLDFLVALVHAADVLMGLFILVMVFLHWAAFRRLAGRMRQPGEEAGETVVADGAGEGTMGAGEGVAGAGEGVAGAGEGAAGAGEGAAGAGEDAVGAGEAEGEGEGGERG